MAGEATVEQAKSPEVRKASNGLMLHIAHGEFDDTKTARLDKNPTQIADKSFDILQQHHTNARNKQQEEQYDRIKKMAAADPEFHGEVTPEHLKHLHFIAWAKIESIRIGAMFRQQKNNPDGQEAIKSALGKLHIVIDENVDASNLPDQFYKTSTNTSGGPGEFYNEFCTGNTNKKLVDALSEQDMIVLKDFLVDTLGSTTAYNALLATKQTQDAIAAKHDFSTDSTAIAMHEYGVLDFFRKGPSSPLADSGKEDGMPEKPIALDRIDGGYTTANPEHPDRNDDASFIDRQNQRGGIFDGAGGYANGDKAAQAAKDAIKEVMDRFPLKGDFPENPIREQFMEAFALANDRVKALGSGKTTASVYQVVRSAQDGSPKLLVVNIGDSRVWIRHKDGSVTQVTQDGGHLRSMHRKELASIPSGVKQAKEEETQEYERLRAALDNASHPQDIEGNQLLEALWKSRNETNLLGSDDFKNYVELFEAPITEGDTVFMTTDGVHDNLTRQQIETIARDSQDADELSQKLVTQARRTADTFETNHQAFRAKPDDITAVATRYETTQSLTEETTDSEDKMLTENDFRRLANEMKLPSQDKEAFIPLGPLYGNMFNDDDTRTLAGKFLGKLYSPLIERVNAQQLQDAVGPDEWGPLGDKAIQQFASEIQAINKAREAKGLKPLSFSNDHIGGNDDFHFNGDRSPVTSHLFYFNKATRNYNPPYNPNEGVTRAYITIDPENKDTVAKNFVDLCETLYEAGINFSAKATSPYGTIKRDDNVVIYIRDSDKDKAAPIIRSFLAEKGIATEHVRAANPDAQDGLSWAPEPTSQEVKMFQDITGSTTQGSFNALVAVRLMPYYLQNLAVRYREIAQKEQSTLTPARYQELLVNAQALEREAQRTRDVITQTQAA